MAKAQAKKHKRNAVLALVAVIVVFGLLRSGADDASSNSTASDSETTPSAEGAVQTSSLGSIGSRARAATSAQIEHINGLMEEGVSAGEGWRLPSDHHRRAQWVAVRIKGPGLSGDDIGVWLVSGTPSSPGMTLPVDSYAEQFSVTRSARKTDAWGSEMAGEVSAFRAWAERQ